MAIGNDAAIVLGAGLRCDMCHKPVRVVGFGGGLCSKCLAGALPFVGIQRVGDYQDALREYREGLDLPVAGNEEARFNPFWGNEEGILKGISEALEKCTYTRGVEVPGVLRGVARDGGCSLSLFFHNLRSARGPGLELLEAEIRGWGVQWDILGLAATW